MVDGRAERALCSTRASDGSYRKANDSQTRRKLLSVRAYDHRHKVVATEVWEGSGLEEVAGKILGDTLGEYLHGHNAQLGCFAVTVGRGRRAKMNRRPCDVRPFTQELQGGTLRCLLMIKQVLLVDERLLLEARCRAVE